MRAPSTPLSASISYLQAYFGLFAMFPALLSSVIVASAIAPALLLLWLVVTADSRPEPPKLVLIAVVLGTLSAILAAIVETGIVPLLTASANPLRIIES